VPGSKEKTFVCFRKAFASAVIPPGVSYQLSIHQPGPVPCDKALVRASKSEGNICVSDDNRVIYGSWNCKRSPTPAYPPADVTFWNSNNCPSGLLGALKTTEEDVKPKVRQGPVGNCYTRDFLSRTLQNSVRATIAKSTKLTIPSGFKCDLLFYKNDQCDQVKVKPLRIKEGDCSQRTWTCLNTRASRGFAELQGNESSGMVRVRLWV